jgi:hypothetical protein
MRKLQNEDGIALITALMFTLITLGMVMALMQMILTQTKMSASHKTYHNALEASYGGAELVTKEFIPRLTNYSTGIGPLLTAFSGTAVGKINLMVNPTPGALKTKLSTDTAGWGALNKTLNPKDAPDLQFQLKGDTAASNYKVYAKIVDTVSGNSDMSGVDLLDSGAGVAGAGSGIAPKHNPSLYTIEVQGEKAAGSKEKAKLSVLYAY